MLIGWVQARLLPCHAIHRIHPVAAAAYEVVMVIPDGQEGQRAELFPHARVDRFGGGLRVGGQPGQHGLAHGQAKACLAQHPHRGDVRGTRTTIHNLIIFREIVSLTGLGMRRHPRIDSTADSGGQ